MGELVVSELMNKKHESIGDSLAKRLAAMLKDLPELQDYTVNRSINQYSPSRESAVYRLDEKRTIRISLEVMP